MVRHRSFSCSLLTVLLVSIIGAGCQSTEESEQAPSIDIDALMEGSWEIEHANVTFFSPDTGEVLAGPVDVPAGEAVPVHFNPNGDPTMLSFGGSFHFGEGAGRWSRIYLTIIEDGEYVRNHHEEYAENPPPFGNPQAGGFGEDWGVDDSLRLVIEKGNQAGELLRVEAMVDMADDGETVWLDYDREAQDFVDGSCINSVHMRRTASN